MRQSNPKRTRSDLAGSNFGGAELLGKESKDLNLEVTDKPQRVADNDGNEIFLPSNTNDPAQDCSLHEESRALKRNN